MGLKRKRGGEVNGETGSQATYRPAIGTRTFATGKSVKHGLATSPLQSLTALSQQIHTTHSTLPLAISHPTVQILQQYLDVSPSLDEILEAWRDGDKHRNEKLTEAAVDVLRQIIEILGPIPFFRKAASGIVARLISSSEPCADLLNGMIQSAKRDQSLIALRLAAAAVHVEPPSIVSSRSANLSVKVWSCLVAGGSSKLFGKLLGKRKRTKDGTLPYGASDPLDRPDIRHAVLHIILPLLSTPVLLASVKSMLHPLYSNMPADPPVTVYRILQAIWSAISTPSQGIARKTALALLDERALEHLLSLLSHHDTEPTSGKTVSEIALAFLEAVTATPGQGICFPDQGWYPRRSNWDKEEEPEAGPSRLPAEGSRDALHNRILSNVMRKVGSKVVDDDSKVGEWAAKVFAAVPELVAGYWPYSAVTLEPRLDSRWISTISYTGRVISLAPPPPSTFHQMAAKGSDPSSMPPHSSPPPISTMIESILPSPLTKVHLSKGLQHSHELVQHLTAQTLARALQKLRVVQDHLRTIEGELEDPMGSDNAWSRSRYELEMEARRRVPDVLVVIAFAQKSATLARVADDEEPDPPAVARSAMLTESALRLLGLYHHTLPSITQEMKFDVGKLLVSSSSVKAERRAKKEHRAGSVISDAGSVASVGTMGTAGMGGGFGQDRGDVEELEALSQAHVLTLLGAAEGWQWSKKAAGSQYTYLYHILLLHLSTPHHITQILTTNLIHQLLGPTLLFEHDPGELDIFISSLPRTSKGDVGVRAAALAQQIHILSFIDDCVRRFMKTPYRYIEDILAVNSEYFDPALRSRELVSGLLMTMLEQLKAKTLGELISTEAAGCVMAYLRRVILGLGGKMIGPSVLSAYVDRLDGAVLEARALGQERKGLRAYTDAMRRDIGKIFDSETLSSSEEMVEPLADELQWATTSYEHTMLYSSDNRVETLKEIINMASSSSAERYARFTLHLLHRAVSTSQLHLLIASVERTTESQFEAVKRTVFADSSVQQMLKTRGSPLGPELPRVIDDLVSLLRPSSPEDQEIAHSFLHDCIAALRKIKKRNSPEFIDTLTALVPWQPFLTPEEAKDIFDITFTHLKYLGCAERPNGIGRASWFTKELRELLTSIIQLGGGFAESLRHLNSFVAAGLFTPLTKAWRAMRRHSPALLTLVITEETINKILECESEEALDLVLALVEASPSATNSLLERATKNPAIIADPRLFKVWSLAQNIFPNGFPYADLIGAAISSSCDHTTTENQDDSIVLLRTLAKQQPGLIRDAILQLKSGSYTASLALLARSMADDNIVTMKPAILHILRMGLPDIVRIISDGEITANEASVIEHTRETLEALRDVELDVDQVEPVIIAVIQDALQNSTAVDLAAALCSTCTLRASFIRQYLGLFLDSKTFAIVSRTSDHPARATIVNLVAAFFKASMYAACQPNFVEPLLSLYHGTLSRSDRQILAIFHTFENFRHLSIGPLLATWSATANSNRALEAVSSFVSAKVFKTCIEFPLRRTLNGEDWDRVSANEDSYDPVFVLSLLALALQEPLSGLEWVEVLRSNVLGVPVCALSSRDEGMRSLGGAVLAKVMHCLKEASFYEQAQLVHTLRLLQHAMPAPQPPEQSGEALLPTSIRLPTLTTLFFAHTLRAIATPSHPLYASTSQFLLQRSTLDAWDVPMLFGMLYASGDGHKRDRSWIVRLIRDGTRSQADWSLLKRRRTIDLLKTLFSSSSDVNFRRLILQALNSITLVPPAGLSLVHRSGVLQWTGAQWALASKSEQEQLLFITDNLVATLVLRHSADTKAGGNEDWLGSVERVMMEACPDADHARLETLSKLLLRMAPILGASHLEALLEVILGRFDELSRDSTDPAQRDIMIENLFNATLSVGATGSSSSYIKRIGELVLDLDSSVGEWARKEMRRAHWDEYAKGSP